MIAQSHIAAEAAAALEIGTGGCARHARMLPGQLRVLGSCSSCCLCSCSLGGRSPPQFVTHSPLVVSAAPDARFRIGTAARPAATSSARPWLRGAHAGPPGHHAAPRRRHAAPAEFANFYFWQLRRFLTNGNKKGLGASLMMSA